MTPEHYSKGTGTQKKDDEYNAVLYLLYSLSLRPRSPLCILPMVVEAGKVSNAMDTDDQKDVDYTTGKLYIAGMINLSNKFMFLFGHRATISSKWSFVILAKDKPDKNIFDGCVELVVKLFCLEYEDVNAQTVHLVSCDQVISNGWNMDEGESYCYYDPPKMGVIKFPTIFSEGFTVASFEVGIPAILMLSRILKAVNAEEDADFIQMFFGGNEGSETDTDLIHRTFAAACRMLRRQIEDNFVEVTGEKHLALNEPASVKTRDQGTALQEVNSMIDTWSSVGENL